jgi:hypothetical protein
MSTYVTNEAQFDVPDGWEDQTITAFASPGDAPRLGLVITKQPIPEGETADQVIDKHLVNAARKLRRLEMRDRQKRVVGGLPGWDVRFVFSHEGVSIYQRQVFAAYGQQVWVVTVSGVAARTDAVDQALEKMLGTLKFRRPAG